MTKCMMPKCRRNAFWRIETAPEGQEPLFLYACKKHQFEVVDCYAEEEVDVWMTPMRPLNLWDKICLCWQMIKSSYSMGKEEYDECEQESE